MPFGNLGTIWAQVGLDTKKLDTGVAAAKVKLASADRSIRTMGQRMSANSTKFMMVGGAMVAAAGAAGGAAVKMASQFETSMRNVNSIMRVSEEEFADISGAVLDISKELPQSATTLATGLYDIASSGFQGADGLTVLEASAKAAAAGLTETEVSAKGITAVLNAYGYSAEESDRVSDTMFRTVDKGVITFEQLSGSLGDVLGTANLANVEFEELSGAIGYMTTQGLNAEVATTALNRTILSIIDPSEELADVLNKAGYESGEMALQQVGLAGVMELVDDAAGGSITQLQTMFKDMRSLRGAGALLGNGIEELSDYMSDFKDTTGATNLALEEQSKSLSYQLDLLKSSISAIGITLGNEFIPAITDATKKLSKFTDENADAIVSIGSIGIKSGLAVGGVLLLTGAFTKLYTYLAAHPIGAFVAAYAGIGTVISNLADNIENDYGRALVKGTNAISGIQGATESWSVASKVAEEYNISLARVLFMNRNKVYEMADAIDESRDSAIKAADVFINRYAESLPVATDKMSELATQFANGEISAEAFAIGIEDLRKATENGHKDIEELGDMTHLTNAEMHHMAEQAKNAGYEVGGLGEEAEDTEKSIDDLRGAFNELIDDIFGHIVTYNDFEEANWAVEDAEKAVAEAIAEHGIDSREAAKAQNELDDANIEAIKTAFELSTSIKATTEEQEEARRKAVELGLQYIETGQIGVDEFWEMASEFGLTSADIIKYADDMGIELDEATRKRVIEVGIEDNASGVIGSIWENMSKLDGKEATVVVRTKEIGSAFGGYAKGGIVGMPQAASGMVIPQTGRAIPVLAHEGEMILNSSQQSNLIDALWGVANGKSAGGGQPININVTAELDGEVIYEKTSQYQYDGQNTRSRLGA